MPRKTRWGIVFLLIGAGVIGAFQVGKAAIAVPALRQELGISLLIASWIVGTLGTVGAAVGLPAGLLMSLFPPRRTMIAGLFAIASGSLLGALVQSGGLLIATRVIEAGGFLLVIISGPRLLPLVTTKQDSQVVFAFWGSYMPAGTAIMMLGGPMLMHAFGWQGLWLFNGALPLLYAFLMARLDIPGADALQPSDRSLRENVRAVLGTPGPILLAFAFATYTFQYFALSSLLPALLVDQMRLSIAAAGLLSAGAVMANALGNLAAGILLRFGIPLWAIVAAGFVTSGVFSFGIFNDTLPAAMVAALAATSLAITGLVPASLFAAAPVVAPTSALLAITIGLITQIGISGQFLGPAALAAFVERYGWPGAPTIFVAVMFLGIAIALALRIVMRREPAD